MKAKNVVIFHAGAKFGGGVDTYYINLFENYNHEKLNLTYMSLGEWKTCEDIRKMGERVVVLPGNRLRPRTIFEISKYLKTNQIDLIVSQGTVGNAYVRAASFLSHVPSLVVVHSHPRYDYSNPIVRFIYMLVDRLMRFQTKRYITVSEYLKKKMVVSGINAGKVRVILNGVKDPGPVSRHSREGGNPGGPIIIGSIGRLHKVKNYAELIRACADLKINNWKLIIIGEGSERKNLENLIAELHVSDRVKLVGNQENIAEQLSQMDIYIQPSLSEGFGITVVEAMLAGKPVVVSPCGSLPELVENGKTGIITDGPGHEYIARALEDLLSQPEKAIMLAEAGQKYARDNFSVEKWIKETEQELIEVAK